MHTGFYVIVVNDDDPFIILKTTIQYFPSKHSFWVTVLPASTLGAVCLAFRDDREVTWAKIKYNIKWQAHRRQSRWTLWVREAFSGEVSLGDEVAASGLSWEYYGWKSSPSLQAHRPAAIFRRLWRVDLCHLCRVTHLTCPIQFVSTKPPVKVCVISHS